MVSCNRLYSPNTPGTKQRQFVSIAPLTTSMSGSMENTRRASPIVWPVSARNTVRKCENGGRFDDLKKHILVDLNKDPNCGTEKAINRHHVHATLSCVGNLTTNCLSLPAKKILIRQLRYWVLNLCSYLILYYNIG